MSEYIIRTKQLQYTYDDGSIALKGIDINIKKGKKIAFLGSNGSGKSTFFLCLNGILKPQKGTVYYEDQPISYKRKGLLDLRSKVQIVFQDPDHQLFCANVEQEISFGILNLGVDEKQAMTKVRQVMEHLEILPYKNKPTYALSGGQKKQVSIADILVMHPQVIMFDEPCSALDPKHAMIVNQCIDELCMNGISVLIATHDMEYAYAWADEIVVFHEGCILQQGTPQAVFANKKIIEQASLTQPYVLQLYDCLCSKGVLSKQLKPPGDMRTLITYLETVSHDWRRCE